VFYNFNIILESIMRKNTKNLVCKFSTNVLKISIVFDNKNNILNCISRDSKLYYKYIETICDNIALYNKLEQIYTHKQLFRFLQNTITQLNILFLHTRNLNKATKIFVAKTQQKTFSQTITTLNEIIYINKIRINYSKCLKLVKQKIINKIDKFC